MSRVAVRLCSFSDAHLLKSNEFGCELNAEEDYTDDQFHEALTINLREFR